jgi:hypothetical protein
MDPELYDWTPSANKGNNGVNSVVSCNILIAECLLAESVLPHVSEVGRYLSYTILKQQTP